MQNCYSFTFAHMLIHLSTLFYTTFVQHVATKWQIDTKFYLSGLVIHPYVCTHYSDLYSVSCWKKDSVQLKQPRYFLNSNHRRNLPRQQGNGFGPVMENHLLKRVYTVHFHSVRTYFVKACDRDYFLMKCK